MIKLMSYSEIPGHGGNAKPPIRVFAEETVEEFLRTVTGFGVVEVTDWPCIDGLDEIRMATKVRDELDRAIDHSLYSSNCGCYVHRYQRQVRAFRIKERVFIERQSRERS